jgi:hypothetical protein
MVADSAFPPYLSLGPENRMHRTVYRAAKNTHANYFIVIF